MPSILDCIEVIRLTGPKWISRELRLNNEDSEEIYLLVLMSAFWKDLSIFRYT